MLLGFLLSIAYVPTWTGQPLFPPGFALLSATLPWLAKPILDLGTCLMATFLIYALIALAWTFLPVQAGWDLWLLAIVGATFVYGRTADLPRVFFGIAIGLCISCVIAGAEVLGYPILIQPYTLPTGLFINPDHLSEACALTALGLLLTAPPRLCWPLPILFSGILLGGGRAAILALGAALGLWLWRFSRAFALIALLLSVLLIASIFPTSKGSLFGSSAAERIAIWSDTADGLTWFGRGPGSFISTYPVFASRTDTMTTRPEAAHNDWLELVYEFGLGAIPFFVLAILALLAPSSLHPLWLAFCIIAFFGFPLRVPLEAFIGFLVLGRISSNWQLPRYNWNPRRSTLHLGLEEPQHVH